MDWGSGVSLQSLSASSANSLYRFAVGGVDAEALVCLLFVIRGRLGGARRRSKLAESVGLEATLTLRWKSL